MHGLGHLDFGPRHLYPALSLFTQPDIKSEDYPGMSRKGGFVGGWGSGEGVGGWIGGCRVSRRDCRSGVPALGKCRRALFQVLR